MPVSNGAVQKKRGSFGWRILPKIKPKDFQQAIYVHRSVTCDTNKDYINSIGAELSGITSSFIFMLSLIKYFEIDPEPDASIYLQLINFYSHLRVKTPLRKRGTCHRLIPAYDLVK